MADKYIYKTFRTEGNADSVREKIAEILLSNGYMQTGKKADVLFFSYPRILFSSKKPLTCISHLSLEVTGSMTGKDKNKEKIIVKIGANFTKIRYFTFIAITTLCFLIPAVLSYIQNGVPDIPPVSYIGIPLGFMIHYHVRMRSFSALKRLILNLK